MIYFVSTYLCIMKQSPNSFSAFLIFFLALPIFFSTLPILFSALPFSLYSVIYRIYNITSLDTLDTFFGTPDITFLVASDVYSLKQNIVTFLRNLRS